MRLLRLARMGGELEDFPLRYLAKLLSSERLAHHLSRGAHHGIGGVG